MSQYKKPRWQDRTNNDRHYCPLCNAWMSSDRQSISLHENGKKHRENVDKDLKRRRDEKAKKEKDQKELEAIFRKVNAVAAGVALPLGTDAAKMPLQDGMRQQRTKQQQTNSKPARHKLTISNHGEPTTTDTDQKATAANVTTLDPHIGHYELEGITYLEGATYASSLFEDDMPIQLWTGNHNASDDELRDLRNFNYWKNALLARVIFPQTNKHDSEGILCHVAYLNNSTEQDPDEIVEKNVHPRRIRLVLGSDPSIPSTLEEARLAWMGGEQTIINAHDNRDEPPEIDENTGLSAWSTAAIRKISTRHYEQNQEKQRTDREQKETKERNEQKEREIRARRMEEAKYENSHDSALGAYDVWNKTDGGGGNGGGSYKGVDITKDAKVDVADTAKSLAKGLGSVAFKKRKAGAKKGGRKTSADDMD